MKTKRRPGRPKLSRENSRICAGMRLYPFEIAALDRLAKAKKLSRGKIVSQLLAREIPV